MSGFTIVTGANLCDATGTKITNATISFQPCNAQGVPLSFSPNGAGQAVDTAVTAQVNEGGFSVVLADSTLTKPANIGYLVTIINNVTLAQMLGPGYIIQPSGAGWSFDGFIPDLGALATIQNGPAGPQGPQGIPGPVNAGVGNNNFGEIPAGAINGTNNVYTLSHSPVMKWLYRNGLFQTPDVDYVMITATTFSYTAGPLSAADSATDSPADAHFMQYTY